MVCQLWSLAYMTVTLTYSDHISANCDGQIFNWCHSETLIACVNNFVKLAEVVAD